MTRLRMAHGFVTNFGFNALAAIVVAVGTVIAIGEFTPTDWGVAAATLSVGQFLGGLLSFGTPLERIRRYSRLSRQEVASVMRRDTSTRLLTAAFVVFAAALTLVWSLQAGSVLICASGVFVSLGTTNHLIAQKRFVAAGLVVLLEKVLTVTCILGLLSLKGPEFWIFPFAYGVLGISIGLVVFAASSSGKKAEWRPVSLVREIARQWKGSLHLGLSSVAPAILLLDVSLVLVLAGHEQAGLFAIGSKVVAPLSVVATSIASVLLPSLASQTRGHLPKVSRAMPSVFVGLFFVALWVALVTADSWVPRLFGESYAGAVWPVRFYLVNVAVIVATRSLVTILQAWDDDRRVSFLVTSQVLVALVGIAIGSLVSGAIGASLSVVVTNSILVVALLFRVTELRRHAINPPRKGEWD